MKQLLSILCIAVVVASCNTQYDKTPSGLAYKIIKGDGKQKLKAGDIIKINGVVKIKGKDTVLFSSYGRLPEYVPYDTTTRKTHDFTEVLKYANVGDSIIAIAQIDTLVNMQALQYNDMFKKGDQITYNIKLVKAFSSQEERSKDQQEELEKEKQREAAQIEAALNKAGTKAQKTPNGAYIVIQNQGDPANMAVPGKSVTVMYKGSLLDTKKVFDSNMDPSFGHPQPFSFVVGSGQTIRAWDDAFPMLGKGGKATIYVPAMLGYGPAGNPPTIPPYATLVFDVQVTDVTNAPPPQAQPQMPQMPQGGNPNGQGN